MKFAFCVVMIALLVWGLGAVCAEDEPFVYDSKGKKDPFVPLVTEEGRYLFRENAPTSVGDIALEGIIWDSKGESFAIVNDVIMKEGDRIGNIQVLKVEPAKVTFLRGNDEFTIELINEEGE